MGTQRNVSASAKFRQSPELKKLDQMIEDEYLKQRRGAKERQKFSFAPSSIGYGNGNCPRYWNIAFKGAMFDDTTDALSIAAMANGTAAHARIEDLFESAGILVSKEVEITTKNPPVRGFIDLIVRMGDETMIGEIKTTTENAWVFRKATMQPADYHLVQLLIYLWATKKDRGFLFYENKNDNKFLTIEVQMNENNTKVLNYVLDWMRDVHKSYEDGKMPKPVYQKRNKFCQQCPVFETCWSDDSWDVELPKLEVKNFLEELRKS